MKCRLLTSFCILAASLFPASSPVLAHHGFAGRYDEEHPFTVQGTVLEFEFINPHSAIIFESEGSKWRHAEVARGIRWRQRAAQG